MKQWTQEMGGEYLRVYGPSEGFEMVVNMGQVDRYLYARRPLAAVLRLWYRIGGPYMLWWAAYRLGALKIEENMVLSSGEWRWPWCRRLMVDYALVERRVLASHSRRAQKEAWKEGYVRGFEDCAGYTRNQILLQEEEECSPN